MAKKLYAFPDPIQEFFIAIRKKIPSASVCMAVNDGSRLIRVSLNNKTALIQMVDLMSNGIETWGIRYIKDKGQIKKAIAEFKHLQYYETHCGLRARFYILSGAVKFLKAG